MKTASRTSSAPNDRDRPRTAKSTAALKRRRTKREPKWYDCIAPPRARRRVREARRWHDELFAATTNGPVRLRWPGQRLFSVAEGSDIRQTAIAELKNRDPELFKALQHVIFWDNTDDSEFSLEKFKRQAATFNTRIADIRIAMRPQEFN